VVFNVGILILYGLWKKILEDSIFAVGRVKVEQEYACAQWMLAPNVLALNLWITWQVPQKNKGTNIEIYNPMDIEFEPHPCETMFFRFHARDVSYLCLRCNWNFPLMQWSNPRSLPLM